MAICALRFLQPDSSIPACSPEQAANWDWMMDTIQGSGREDVRVLNLFAYTGGQPWHVPVRERQRSYTLMPAGYGELGQGEYDALPSGES